MLLTECNYMTSNGTNSDSYGYLSLVLISIALHHNTKTSDKLPNKRYRNFDACSDVNGS